SQPIPRGNRVGIITNTGGPAVIATDVLVGAGLKLPPLSEKTAARLKAVLYAEASVHNPVDVLATGTAAHYRACMDAMMDDDNFDSVYINFVTPFFVDNESIAREIVAVSQQRIKPIVCNLMTDPKQWTEVVSILRTGGVPCFNLPGAAARALSALVRYNGIRNRKTGMVPVYGDVDKSGARALLEGARAAGRSNLSAAEVYGFLSAYKIPVADWQVVGDVASAAAAAARIGYPVVVKADAQTVVHKSDMGGVAVNLTDETMLRAAVQKMQTALAGTTDLKFLIQKFQPGGLEVIMGAKAEPGLGHLIMFGLGGIYVEIMKDVVFDLTPVTDTEAQQMVASIKGAALLKGVRGQAGVDRAALVDLIGRLSQLVTDLPEIQEMDLNPVMALRDSACAVDARIAI
ncbi:MAG: acetate--CoA ligase family protein, partial [Pseudomonadota bacterium]